jgi:thiamine biosynthesis lipoprotein
VLDRENMTARLTDPKSSVDVGAIAKGYATERAAELLESMGADGYALSFSGNIRTVGKHPDDGLWDIKIRNPLPDATGYATELKLEACAVVTSGGYENFYEVDGVRYHHIIDKDTLMPSEHFASVSIITKDSGLADALSTALFTMSYEDGLALVTSLGGVEVLWITPEGEQHMTDGFKQLITEAN